MPENDEWVYSYGYSRACSTLIADIYKKAGIFGNHTIRATEFTPRDLGMLKIWDSNYKSPAEC